MTTLHPIVEAERILRDLLGVRGIDPDAPQAIGPVWAVFGEFVALPFATASDGVLYQVGTYGEPGEEELHLEFLRQLEVRYDDGEHDHYEQLHCEFRFPASDATRAFGTFERWWFRDSGADSWREFAALVGQRPEFVALRNTKPRGFAVWQEEV